MEHLVEGHLGGYYISDDDPEIIESYCEQCGDSDRIILSWEKGNKMETLFDYFMDIKMTKEKIENNLLNNDDKEELIDYLKYQYDCDRYIINELKYNDLITNEERLLLLKQVSLSQKKQFEILREINFDTKKINKNKKLIKINEE